MSTATEIGDDLIRFDDFCALVADGQKADLLDGVIYMASPDSRRANELTSFLDGLLRMFISAKGIGGEVYVNRFAFRITDLRAPEPDVAYVSEKRMHLVRDGAMDGGPDVAVEVVSRDSCERDYVHKRRIYEEAGVAEYWIVDPIQRRVEFLRLGEDGRYDLSRLEGNCIFRSRSIPGFWLNVEWLIGNEPLNAYGCLQELLV